MEDGDEHYAANRAFHFKVYEIASSPLHLSLMRLTWQSMLSGPMVSRSHHHSWLLHEQLINDLEPNDGDLSKAVMRAHILGTSASVGR